MQPHNSRTIIAGLIGNIVEWYDFALYGYLAVILSNLFFPGDSATSLAATYGIFAAGFLMRPIGALLFGLFGDLYGRRAALFISVSLMGGSTFLLGLLPTYATVGIWAAVLLIGVRLLQGLSVGGEFSTSATYMIENASSNRRGLVGSFANFGSIIGTLLGSAIAAGSIAFLSHDVLLAWGWRIPFLFGGVIALFAFWLRRHLPPSPLFIQEEHHSESPLHILLFQNRRELAAGTLFASGYAVAFYISLVYLPSYLNTNLNLPLDKTLWINAAALAFTLPLIIFFAYISDRYIKRRNLLLLVLSLLAIISIPLFSWITTVTWLAVISVQFIFALIMSVLLGVVPAFFVELFPTKDRLTAYSITFNGAFGIFGGTAPLLSAWLITITGNNIAPAFYLAFAVLLSGVGVYLVKDRSREPLR